MPKSFTLRAKLSDNKRAYRDIKLSTSASLLTLAKAIISAFDFEFDHMCGFYERPSNQRSGRGRAYTMFADNPETQLGNEGEISISKHKLDELWHDPKDTWYFHFDYGDDWRFDVQLIAISPEGTPKAEVVKSAGEAPDQYPDYDDEDEDINQPRIMNEDETMVAIAIILRHKHKVLLVEPNISDSDFLWPLLPQRHPTLEESVRQYCASEFGVDPTGWVGIAPFTTKFGAGNSILYAPYIIDVATTEIRISKDYRGHRWCVLAELEDYVVAGFMAPVLDYLYEDDLMRL